MKRDAWLWFATAAGPIAWFGDLVISFAVVPGPRRPPDAPVLLAISAAALVLAAIGGLVGFRLLRAQPVDGSSRARFLAEAGVALSGIAIVLVVATSLPTMILMPGAEP